jgi:hypothetical protein
MDRFLENITIVLVDDNGAHVIAKMYNQLQAYFEVIDENVFGELLTYTSMVTKPNKQSTLALFEDGAMCSYPNRDYESVKEILVVQ